MKAINENRLSMYLAVRKVLNNHELVWNGTPAFVDGVNAIKTKIEGIEQAMVLQLKRIHGVTENKKALRERLVSVAIKVANAGYVYAQNIDDVELRSNVNFSKAKLLTCRDTLTLERCQLIYDSLLDLFPLLATYGIVQADVDEFVLALSTFEENISSPRNAIINRKNATLNIDVLVKEVDALLAENLDKLMELFMNSPVFADEYFNARRVIDSGSRGTHLKGRLFDKANQKNIADALVQVRLLILVDGIEVIASDDGIEGIEQALPEILKTTTDSDGNFEVRNLKAGSYNITFSKPGYVLQAIEKSDIRRGKTLNVGAIGMERVKRFPPQISD